jgi:hypothetical protein
LKLPKSLNYTNLTLHKQVLVLGQVFQSRNDPIYDIIHVNVFGQFLQFEAGNAANFRLDVVDVLYDVRKKRLEVLLTHGLSE